MVTTGTIDENGFISTVKIVDSLPGFLVGEKKPSTAKSKTRKHFQYDARPRGKSANPSVHKANNPTLKSADTRVLCPICSVMVNQKRFKKHTQKCRIARRGTPALPPVELIELAFFTDDLAKTTDQYRILLEIEPEECSSSHVVFRVGSMSLVIHSKNLATPDKLQPVDYTAYRVGDVDSKCSLLVTQGWILEVAPSDYKWGRSAYLRDPNGHQVEITQAKTFSG